MLEFKQDDHHDVEHSNQLPFILVDNLGHGHTSTVEKVQDKNSKAFFARKISHIPTGRTAKSKRLESFQKEVRLIRKLQHHHVVHVFATYAMVDRLGLILWPAADEGDLLKFFKRHENFVERQMSTEKPDQRIDYMNKILKRAFGCLAGGLEFMHGFGIQHKDIKPENILIHEGFVLYTDFGCSVDVSRFSQSISDGRGGFTEKYHAPEGLDFEGRNQFSDVFSLGCVFLEMLSVLTDDSRLCPEVSDSFPQERCIFAASMKRIHLHLDQLQLSPSLEFLQGIIKWMTQYDRDKRPTASQVFQTIIGQPEFGCTQCYAKEKGSGKDSQRWLWSEAHKDYYFAFHDSQGEWI
jgi:serine/threonine protein kinase